MDEESLSLNNLDFTQEFLYILEHWDTVPGLKRKEKIEKIEQILKTKLRKSNKVTACKITAEIYKHESNCYNIWLKIGDFDESDHNLWENDYAMIAEDEKYNGAVLAYYFNHNESYIIRGTLGQTPLKLKELFIERDKINAFENLFDFFIN